MKKTSPRISLIALHILLSVFLNAAVYSSLSIAAESATHYKPFILAQTISSSDINKAISNVKTKLNKGSFEVVGEYSPYPNVHIVIVTSAALRNYATQSENGVYGAIQRISITSEGNQIQIAFTNPTYMAHVYQFKTDLGDITKALKNSLGFIEEYGSEDGLTELELRDYQYKLFMPDFTDKLELAEYSSQPEALEKVNKALTDNEGGVSKIYQVDLKDREETIIGVQMKENIFSDCSSDKFIMGKIDFKKIKSSGHLPYELIVKKGNVYALFAEFRIAISFPDLSMMGDNSFMSIMCAPGSIQKALTLGAGGDPDE